MVNIYRLVYTDSGGNQQVIGTTENDFTNARLERSKNGFYHLKVWSSASTYGNLPVGTSSFQADEPEIFWQEKQSDGSYENKFRGYLKSQGAITEDGQHVFKLWGFGRYLAGQKTGLTSPVTNNIVDAFSAILPAGYVVEAPASSNVSYKDDKGTDQTGYPPVDSYTLNDARGVGFRELSTKYNWVFRFSHETDGSGNYKVFFEPLGFGGTIDTLYSREDYDGTGQLATFREWDEGEFTGYNNVIVQGNGFEGDLKTRDIGVEDRFKRVKLGYVDSVTECNRIAENFLDRMENLVGPSGQLKVAPRYAQDVVNSSFELNSSQRNVNSESFTCTKQVNFYPENSSYLFMDFEAQYEKKADSREDIRDERADLIGSDSIDVGGQNVSGSTETVSDRYDDFGNDNHEHDNVDTTSNVNNSFITDNSLGQVGGAVDAGDTLSVTANAGDFVSGVDYVEISVMAKVRDVPDYGIVVENDTQNFIILDEEFTQSVIDTPAVSSFTLTWDIVDNNDRFKLTVFNEGTSTTQMDLEILVASKAKHDHDVPISKTIDNNTGGINSTNTADSTAGDTSSLETDGSTDPKNIDVAQQNKTDR